MCEGARINMTKYISCVDADSVFNIILPYKTLYCDATWLLVYFMEKYRVNMWGDSTCLFYALTRMDKIFYIDVVCMRMMGNFLMRIIVVICK